MKADARFHDQEVLEFPTREARPDQRVGPLFLVGEREHRQYPLDPEKIDYIEANHNYVSIRIGSQAYISRDSMTRLANELAPLAFIRIERSYILNIRAVLYVTRANRGTFVFTLRSDVSLRSSVTYRKSIVRALPLASYSPRRFLR